MNRKGLESHARDWADFFLANQGPLVAYALSLVGGLPAAEDLIQDVLVRMVRQNRPVRNAKAFVLRCMRNLAIDRRRAAKSRPTMIALDGADLAVDETGAAFIDDQSGDPVRRECAQSVKAALECLPADRREVIVLKIYAGLTFREIAEILDAPIGTVTSTYSRGLDELRTVFDSELKHVV